MKTALFVRGPSPTLRFSLLLVLSVALMVLDQKTQALESLHRYIGTFVHPLQRLVDLPSEKLQQIRSDLKDDLTLKEENLRLREENQKLSARLQEFLAIREENDQLRALLDSSLRQENEVTSARLLAVSLNPFQQRVLIDKGETDGVTAGITIVDQSGIMGQVTRTFPFHSEGILASDPNHAIPVQSLRSGERGIVVGTGAPNRFKVLNIPKTADLVPGDTLVTSGIGGRFPPDYPVAIVTNVNQEPGLPFAAVTAKPLASLSRSKAVLLVKSVPRINQSTEQNPSQTPKSSDEEREGE